MLSRSAEASREQLAGAISWANIPGASMGGAMFRHTVVPILLSMTMFAAPACAQAVAVSPDGLHIAISRQLHSGSDDAMVHIDILGAPCLAQGRPSDACKETGADVAALGLRLHWTTDSKAILTDEPPPATPTSHCHDACRTLLPFLFRTFSLPPPLSPRPSFQHVTLRFKVLYIQPTSCHVLRSRGDSP
jgi:hypothetical protein